MSMGIKLLQWTQYKVEAFSPTADNSACCNQLGRGIIAGSAGQHTAACDLHIAGGEKVQCVLCAEEEITFCSAALVMAS